MLRDEKTLGGSKQPLSTPNISRQWGQGRPVQRYDPAQIAFTFSDEDQAPFEVDVVAVEIQGFGDTEAGADQ